MILKYRDAFSLHDEIGACLNLKADIQVIGESPFFVRPFPLSENDKSFMDEQMEQLVSLGILSKNSTSHTSPVMLITRKLTKDKRPVVDQVAQYKNIEKEHINTTYEGCFEYPRKFSL